MVWVISRSLCRTMKSEINREVGKAVRMTGEEASSRRRTFAVLDIASGTGVRSILSSSTQYRNWSGTPAHWDCRLPGKGCERCGYSSEVCRFC
jgi:hypothetical protein